MQDVLIKVQLRVRSTPTPPTRTSSQPTHTPARSERGFTPLVLAILNGQAARPPLFDVLGPSSATPRSLQGRPGLCHGFWPAMRVAMLRVGFRSTRTTALPVALSIFRSSLVMT